jgi:outer membrane receptor protein involved in Fe transport
MFRHARGPLAAALLCSTTLIPAARAQTNTGVDEIVVTAEKRASTVQKTPISMTAISGDELLASGTADVLAVAQETPGISFKTSGPGQTELEMRGLTSSGGAAPTVGFYLDETPLTPPAAAQNGKVVIDPNLYDLSRVEVLRGPQGTLYGSGSMGGTIKLITNQPDPNAYSGSVTVDGSGTESGGPNYGVSGMVNLPLVADKAALRLVGTDNFTSGWIDRKALGDNFPLETNPAPPTFYGATRGNVASAPVQSEDKDANWERLEGGRATLLVKPVDDLSITPMVLYQRITMGAPSTIDTPPGIGQEAHYEAYDIAEPFADTFKLFGNVAKYDVADISITAATSYWTREEKQTQDTSEVMQNAFSFPAYSIAGGGVGPASISENDLSHQFSQELRIASDGTGPLQWLIGGFYSDFASDYDLYSFIPGFLAEGFPTSRLVTIAQHNTINQKAVFGEGSYQVLSDLKATIGLRYYTYDSTLHLTQAGIVTASGNDTPTRVQTQTSASGVNPKFNLSYTPTDDLTVYGTAAKGYRPGGPNQVVPLSGAQQCLVGLGNLQSIGKTSAPLGYGPDSIWSYELGEKAKLFDQRVTVNADIYYENWSKVQTLVPLTCGYPFTDNAASAEVYGSELEIKTKVTSELTFSAGGGYTHATYSADSVEASVTKGETLLDVPSWTGNVSLVYTRPINDAYDFTARISDDYVGARTDLSYAINNLPAYNLVNLRLGIIATAWEGSLYANNLTDKRALISNTNALAQNMPTFNRTATNQPRTFGAELTYRF